MSADEGVLTDAEKAVVAARLADNPERSEDEVVAEVKAERVGPAAAWEDITVPVSAVADEIVAVREALDEASQRRIANAGNDSDRAINEAGRLKRHLDEINAYLVADAEAQAAAGRTVETEPAVEVEAADGFSDDLVLPDDDEEGL